jgi:hypothetical protein
MSLEILVAVASLSCLAGVLLCHLVLSNASVFRRRCRALPLETVRCARRAGHVGRHHVYPADVTSARYERVPF